MRKDDKIRIPWENVANREPSGGVKLVSWLERTQEDSQKAEHQCELKVSGGVSEWCKRLPPKKRGRLLGSCEKAREPVPY